MKLYDLHSVPPKILEKKKGTSLPLELLKEDCMFDFLMLIKTAQNILYIIACIDISLLSLPYCFYNRLQYNTIKSQ